MTVTTGNRPQSAGDGATDCQALTGGDITKYRALVARIRYLSQDRPDLKLGSMQVCCAMANPFVHDMERVKRIGRYFAGCREQSAGSAGKREVKWKPSWTPIGGATKLVEDPCQPGSS